MKRKLKKFWNFLWHDDSLLSLAVSAILIILFGKFILYPILGMIFGTSLPIVAVVSNSMEHNTEFEKWWTENSEYYESIEIKKSEFESYDLKDGFNKGDAIVLKGVEFEDIHRGDVIVFQSRGREPIIHRVVELSGNSIGTKGDNNPRQLIFEEHIYEDEIIGKTIARVPLLGWVKVIFMEFLGQI
jgi:signal peptidase I